MFSHEGTNMKMTADQLLEIAGIASTDALRARLNEFVDDRYGGDDDDEPASFNGRLPTIRKVTYKYEPEDGGVEIVLVDKNGVETSFGDGSLDLPDLIASGQIDRSFISTVDFNDLMFVSHSMSDEDEALYDEPTAVRKKAVLQAGREEYDRLFPGVPASFEIVKTAR